MKPYTSIPPGNSPSENHQILQKICFLGLIALMILVIPVSAANEENSPTGIASGVNTATAADAKPADVDGVTETAAMAPDTGVPVTESITTPTSGWWDQQQRVVGSGYWNFTIINNIYSKAAYVNVDGSHISYPDNTCRAFYAEGESASRFYVGGCSLEYIEVTVPDDVDSVNVYIVTSLTDCTSTNVVVTKDYISQLRKWGRDDDFGDEPVLLAYGGVATYDVDAGILKKNRGMKDPHFANSSLIFTPYEHLKKGGTIHNTLRISQFLENGKYLRVLFPPDKIILPVTIERAGYWGIAIYDKIIGTVHMKINNVAFAPDEIKIIAVNVPDSLDTVDIEFDVSGGCTTKVNLTKEDVNMLRAWGKDNNYGDEPILIARGCIDTYDVDAGVLKKPRDPITRMITETTFTPYEHLKARGSKYSHWPLNKSKDVSHWDELLSPPLTYTVMEPSPD